MSDKKQVNIVASGPLYALKVGSKWIPVSGYKMQSSISGATEICVTIIRSANDIQLNFYLECLRIQGTEISIVTSEAGHVLKVGSEMVPVSAYKIQRSADGTTEFSVTITGFSKDSNLKLWFE